MATPNVPPITPKAPDASTAAGAKATPVAGKVTPTVDPNVFEVDGEKVSKDQLIERYKKSKGLESSVQEGVKAKQTMASLIQQLKEDPIAVLQNPALGHDVKEMLGKWYYENVVVPSKLSPEARKAAELEAENKKLKAEKEKEETDRKTKSDQEAFQQARATILKSIQDEIPTSGLPFSADLNKPADASLVARITRKLYLANKANQAYSVKQAISSVKQDLLNEQKHLLKEFGEDNILEFLDPETVEKINKAMVKRLKAKQKDKAPAKATEGTKAAKDMSPQERRAYNREIEKKLFGR